IKNNIKLDGVTKASVDDSKKVVEICTIYAQKGMLNIFLTIFFSTLAFAFADAYFFIGYLISIAVFGLFQAIFMANAGGAWDNAKKVVETELHAKGTDLHAASVVGDTVGDPFKYTSSVAMNSVIKFTTLFGLLAVELAVMLPVQYGADTGHTIATAAAVVCFAISVFFVWRSFYGMRIKSEAPSSIEPAAEKAPAAAESARAPRLAGRGPSGDGPDCCRAVRPVLFLGCGRHGGCVVRLEDRKDALLLREEIGLPDPAPAGRSGRRLRQRRGERALRHGHRRDGRRQPGLRPLRRHGRSGGRWAARQLAADADRDQ